jgi:hypothetical protein
MTADTSEATGLKLLQARFNIKAHDWLSLAAAPSFAMLALLNQNPRAGMPAFCAAVQGGSPLTGMVPMYLLMSIVHATPWVRLLSRRRRRCEGS